MDKSFIKRLLISFILWLCVWSICGICLYPQKNTSATIVYILLMTIATTAYNLFTDSILNSYDRKRQSKKIHGQAIGK